jgi:GLPGLI family protein
MIASVFALNAQKFEGQIIFNYTYNDLPEGMEGMEAMLPKEMTITVKDNISKIDMSMGMGMSMSIISNSESKKSTMYMDMMGQKIAFEKTVSKKEETAVKNQTINITKETKVIAGYTCTKATIKNGENEMEVWFTKELPKLGNGSQVKGLDGFPMEFTVNKGGMNITISASKVEKKKVSDTAFKVPEGYEMKTEEEMKKLIPGM